MARSRQARYSRRTMVASGVTLATVASLQNGAGAAKHQMAASPEATPVADPAASVRAIIEEAMTEMHLRAVLVRVTADGEDVITRAFGESVTGVPATTDMHVRNGAVAISYVSTLLLLMVERGEITLDDTIGEWRPFLPEADRVTLRMLANMTAGYPDYVQHPDFVLTLYNDPFRQWTPEELLAFSLDTSRLFDPGTNWDYSHSNYVILGLVLESVIGMPLGDALRTYVLDPLELNETGGEQTAWMPERVLHAYSSERRETLGITPDRRFYEESTYWNPSWTLPRGAVQYSTITDMATSAEAVGKGTLLSPELHREQVGGQLLGFGQPLEGCPSCHTLDEMYLYGLGIVKSGGWVLQNPLFAGYGGTTGYHSGQGIAIAVVTTFREQSFDETGDYGYGNASQTLFRRIGEMLVPEDPPLIR